MKPISTIRWSGERVKILDQTRLPVKQCYIYCDSAEKVWKAIRTLQVRGAPAIGIAAAMGVVLGIRRCREDSFPVFLKNLEKVCSYLFQSRPTAVNLSWALERMKAVCRAHSSEPIGRIKKILRVESQKILSEDLAMCERMGIMGARLVRDGDRILTHCNAGGLATAGYGTALAVIYKAEEAGKKVFVYADETRPLLQGSRLTAWELSMSKVDVTLICDSMAAHVIKEKKVDKVFVGADRIAANGDAANKIGTYGLALICHCHKIPFYVVAPQSTFDLSVLSGDDIPIEERPGKEIIFGFGRPTAPRNVKTYNPAFDVTPSRLITAIITDKGIIRKPYKKNIKKLINPQC